MIKLHTGLELTREQLEKYVDKLTFKVGDLFYDTEFNRTYFIKRVEIVVRPKILRMRESRGVLQSKRFPEPKFYCDINPQLQFEAGIMWDSEFRKWMKLRPKSFQYHPNKKQ